MSQNSTNAIATSTGVPSFSHIVYTDGACKNNNSSADDTTTVRKAGSGIVVFDRLAHEALHCVHRDYVEHGSSASLPRWRTALLTRQSPFSTVVCRHIPLRAPPPPPNKISNNRAELDALVSALAHFVALAPATCATPQLYIDIRVDSKYVITTYNNARQWRANGWKLASGTVACNVDQAEEMLLYCDALRDAGHTVTLTHVPAHTDVKDVPRDFDGWCRWFGNDMADRLTNIAAGVETDINYKVAAKKRKR